MLKQAVTRLRLSYFRNYTDFHCDFQPLPVLITGNNGAGKTNLLEAVSMLSVGKGLRNAKLSELNNHHQSQSSVTHSMAQSWAVSAQCLSQYGTINIGTAYDIEHYGKREKRNISINAAPAQQQRLNEYINCCWLTPQMDHLFLAPSSERRRFFDRMIAAKQPNHYGYVHKLEKLNKQRLHILIHQDNSDNLWLDAIEQQIAEMSANITFRRIEFLQHLEKIAHENLKNFPKPYLHLHGVLCNDLLNKGMVTAQENFIKLLVQSRALDKEKQMTHCNVQRQDIITHYGQKNIAAAQASTGEQKALLIMLILAHTLYLGHNRDIIYLLLLDEVVAHLDSNRRDTLLDILHDYHIQYWITATDKNHFQPMLKGSMQHLTIDNGTLTHHDD